MNTPTFHFALLVLAQFVRKGIHLWENGWMGADTWRMALTWLEHHWTMCALELATEGVV